MARQVAYYKSHNGPEILAPGLGMASALSMLFCNYLLEGDTFVWWALGTLK